MRGLPDPIEAEGIWTAIEGNTHLVPYESPSSDATARETPGPGLGGRVQGQPAQARPIVSGVAATMRRASRTFRAYMPECYSPGTVSTVNRPSGGPWTAIARAC